MDRSNFIQRSLSQFTGNPALITFLLIIDCSKEFGEKSRYGSLGLDDMALNICLNLNRNYQLVKNSFNFFCT